MAFEDNEALSRGIWRSGDLGGAEVRYLSRIVGEHSALESLEVNMLLHLSILSSGV